MEQRIQTIYRFLGQHVHIVVDRPIGYQHKNMVYPVNYGYIPGVIAGDGEEQDAYILGVTEPVEVFDGWVIGAVRRKNDCEDKLVVAPVGTVFHQGEIAEKVYFQEQFFDTEIISLVRKSCGVIPYRNTESNTEYLIVQQTNRQWSFPKGHMDMGETEKQTALRELNEEIGLTAVLDNRPPVVVEYALSPQVKKQVLFFLGKAKGIPKIQASEILSFRWVTADKLKDFLHPDTYNICKEFLL